uniref:Uncharacterized LOC100181226 n=1 Tax=Ciona intestinalis TaxID=7719 RepID=H2XS22_CIOIN|nr:uncharacterized protein LOC100181226 [Ciona intestinalis]|eukprot:XP_002131332.1 uncharacterized protein LOC100181226 [Ciona intestinalis]
MLRYESFDSDRSSSSDISNSSWFSYSSDLPSVFGDEAKERPSKINPGMLRNSAQQLAKFSAKQHYPKFTPSSDACRCSMLHWACYVGWCLCKYQYQPLTPLHLLPNTAIIGGNLEYATSRKLSEGRVHSDEGTRGPSKNRPQTELKYSSTKDEELYLIETTV